MEEGDKIVSDFHQLVGKFNKLTTRQVELIKCLLNMYLPFIYGENFDEYKKQNKIKDDPSKFGLIPTTRGEKTLPVSVFCACVLLTVPGANLIVYSPAKRQADQMLWLIRKHLEYLECDHLYNKENLSVVVNGDRRKVSTLPSKEGVRGASGNLITCLEGHCMPKKFINEVIMPLSTVTPVNFMYQPDVDGWLYDLENL